MTTHLLVALTPVHVGTGIDVGSINLPLARETHTRWPNVPGSSLKGALRARATYRSIDAEALRKAFGGEHEDADHKGGLRFTDANMLAMPVRCIHHGYVLITCPLALARFAREISDAPAVPQPDLDVALCAPDADAKIGVRDNQTPISDRGATAVIYLEHLDWLLRGDTTTGHWVDRLKKWTGTDEVEWDRLVVVHDDVFAYALAAWTMHRTRNAVGEDGIVEDGLLYSVEYLAPESVLWCDIFDADSHEQALPKPGQPFVIGGHTGTGCGRVVFLREATT